MEKSAGDSMEVLSKVVGLAGDETGKMARRKKPHSSIGWNKCPWFEANSSMDDKLPRMGCATFILILQPISSRGRPSFLCRVPWEDFPEAVYILCLPVLPQLDSIKEILSRSGVYRQIPYFRTCRVPIHCRFFLVSGFNSSIVPIVLGPAYQEVIKARLSGVLLITRIPVYIPFGTALSYDPISNRFCDIRFISKSWA